jgi:hypothetical protein
MIFAPGRSTRWDYELHCVISVVVLLDRFDRN